MNNLIIESIGRRIEKDFSKTSVAHARNSVILADIVGADILADERDLNLFLGKKYKNIICSYASPYMKYKKFVQIIEENPDAKLWWFVNDHDLEDNILLRNVIIDSGGKRKINMLCNNPREGYRGWILRKKIKDRNGNVMGLLDDFIEEWHTFNINVLIYNGQNEFNWEDKFSGAIYYGTFRKHRLEDFLEYQHKKLVISASKKIQTKFRENGVVESSFGDKLTWDIGKEHLNHYKFSLYIEDKHTHDNYAFMANRFYEALMCNCLTFFDKKCIDTIEKSGYDVDNYFVVDGREEFLDKISVLNDEDKFLHKLNLYSKIVPVIEEEKKAVEEFLIKLLR